MCICKKETEAMYFTKKGCMEKVGGLKGGGNLCN